MRRGAARFLGPERGDQEDRRRRDPPREVRQGREGQRVRPVQVFENHDGGMLVGRCQQTGLDLVALAVEAIFLRGSTFRLRRAPVQLNQDVVERRAGRQSGFRIGAGDRHARVRVPSRELGHEP